MKNIRCAACKLTAIFTLQFILSSVASFAAPSPPESPAITAFSFEVQHNPGKIQEDIIADIYGDSLIVGIIPYQQAEFNLTATFLTGPAETVRVNGVDQQSTVTVNDFSSTVIYTVSSAEGTRTYKVRLIYTGLPLVYVYTQDAAPILNKEDYVNATMKIYPGVDTIGIFSGELEIRGRGNTTWTLPKKPYRIKLGSAASLLGMPSDKDWVLLANYSDKSLMRNSLAYHLGAQMNLAYTQRSHHVDLVLNGVYQGNYVLGEHIKVDKDRVNITELEEDDTDEAVINGGYFLELDDYRDGTFFELESGLPFVVKSPDDIPQVQLDYITSYMQQTEDAILSGHFANPDSGYAKFINTETFIEWYWVNEVMKNIDARDVSSIFYYKDRDEKLNMGPLWDLDVAAGNASVNTGDDPTSFYVRESTWFKRLFEDPAFRSAAEARWFTFRDELLASLPEVIDAYADKLKLSQQQNFYKWDILNQPIWPSTLVLGSYDNEVDYLKEWLSTRIAWIDAQVPKPALISFNLSAPANEARLVLSAHDDGQMKFSWTPSTSGSSYEVLIDRVDGDFSNAIAMYPSDSSSLDTTATVSLSQLYELLDAVDEEDSVSLKWTVHASLDEQEKMASDTFLVKIVNGDVPPPVITGVGDDAYGVSMFPNPTSGEFYIEIPSSTLIEHATVVDALGRKAASSELSPGTITRIDVSNLRRGLYVVILGGKIDRPVTKKIFLR